jgi:hypothetical protein
MKATDATKARQAMIRDIVVGLYVALLVGGVLWSVGRTIYQRGEAHGWQKGFTACCELYRVPSVRPRVTFGLCPPPEEDDNELIWLMQQLGVPKAAFSKRRDH